MSASATEPTAIHAVRTKIDLPAPFVFGGIFTLASWVKHCVPRSPMTRGADAFSLSRVDHGFCIWNYSPHEAPA
jgi:hypothetical protein